MQKEDRNIIVRNFLQILTNKVIPWSIQNGMHNLIVARKNLDEESLPPDVKFTRKPIKGPRVVSQFERPYGHTGFINARYPEDGLVSFRDITFICVLEGNVNFQIYDNLLLLKEGYFILCPPYIPRGEPAYEILRGASKKFICEIDEYKLLWFLRLGNGLRIWISGYTDGKFYAFQPGEHFFLINPTASLLLEEVTEIVGKESRDDFIKNGSGLLTAFLQLIRFQLKSEGPIFPNPTAELSEFAEKQDVRNPMLMALNYIQGHLSESLTISHVAQQVYMSRSRFAEQFPAFIGKTFAKFLTEERLKTAKILLHDTEWSIKEISMIVGFQQPSTFYHIFKRQTGITPENYRYQFRK